MTKHAINQRFKIAINYLIDNELAKNKSEIAKMLNSSPQKFSEILNDRMSVSIEMISDLIVKYNVNPYYILNGNGGILDDAQKNAIIKCQLCSEKDKRINELKETIDLLKEHIDTLKRQ